MTKPQKKVKQVDAGKCLNEKHRQCDFLAEVINRSADGVAIAKPGGKIIYMNDAMAGICGYKVKDITSIKQWSELVVPDEKLRKEMLSIWRKDARSSEVSPAREFKFAKKNGKECWGRFRSSRMTFQGVDSIIIHGQDITERKKTETQLLRTQFSLDHAMDPVMWLSEKGKLIYVNEAACRALGYSKEELLKLKLFDFTPSTKPADLKKRWSVIKQEGAVKFESIHRTKQGVEFPVEISVSIQNYEGEEFCYAIVRDISGRKQSEKLLRGSEEKFRAIVESSPMGMHMYRMEGKDKLVFIGANPAASKILGVDNSIFIGKTILEAFPPLADTNIPQKYIEAALNGTDFSTEQLIYADKKIAGAFAVYAFQTSQNHMTAMFSDITARKQAEEALRDSEGRYRSFMDNFHGIAFRMGVDMVPIFVHGSVKEITGYTDDDFVNGSVDWVNVCHEDYRAELKKQNKAMCTTANCSHNLEYQIVTEDGKVKWIRERAQNVCDENGVPLYFQGAIYDITDRKHAEAQMKRLAAAVTEAAESIIITDVAGVVQYVNPWFERMTGFKSEEIIGQHSRVLGSGKHDAEFYGKMWDSISSGSTWRGHFVNKKKDGTLFEENAVISPVRDAAGNITNYVCVKRDVTQEKALESQVKQSQKMAAVGQLAHKVAHAFTNVLVVILGNAQLAKQEADISSKVCNYLDEVIKAGNRISTLTAELLAFAHPAPLTARPMELDRVLLGVEEMLIRTIDPGVELTIDAKRKVGKVCVDPTQIEQVVMHAAINAGEAMPNGGKLKIEARPATNAERDAVQVQESAQGREAHKGDFGVLVVSDSGCGMTEEVRARIFEPFFTDKGNSKNTGLGLSTAYSIVDQHNGYVEVQSQPDKGTVLKVFLPIVPGK